LFVRHKSFLSQFLNPRKTFLPNQALVRVCGPSLFSFSRNFFFFPYAHRFESKDNVFLFVTAQDVLSGLAFFLGVKIVAGIYIVCPS